MKKLLTMIGAAAVATGAMVPTAAWADKVRVYDVDDYVQDGLVAHFDAIRNAGATAAHDDSATTWANLVDAANYADFTLRANSASAGWTDIAYVFTNNCMASTISEIDLGTNFTVQIAVTGDGAKQTTGKYEYHAWFNDNPKNNYGFWTQSNGTAITGNFNTLKTAPSGNVRPAISSWGGEYVTWMLDGANGLCYTFETDTIPSGKALTVVSTYPAARKYCWGGELKDGTTLQSFVVADYHNVRMYNRPLMEDEIKQNRIVDEARYRNETTKGKIPNVVVIGENATDTTVKYAVEGTETFAMPETVVMSKGAFRRYGYVLETRDGTEWTGAVTNFSGSCEIAADGVVRRITWLWTDILRSYDVDDYVQDGLVAHFDGIRNAGAGAAHDSLTRTWKNLVTGGADAVFNSDGPAWTNSAGCFFNNNGAAYITGEIDLGTNFTIQLATDIDLSSQRTGKPKDGWDRYRNYFNSNGSADDNKHDVNGLWTDNYSSASTKLIGNFNHYRTVTSANLRPEINPWGGKYVTKMLSGEGRVYFFEGDSLPSGTAFTITNAPPPGQTYSWGALTNETSKGHSVSGTFHSIRMYTNTLDNAQLQLNRKIDEARFRGNGDVTIVNGAIGETGTNGESSFPDGCYNFGYGESWTLTAESVVVDGRRYQPRLVVEEKVDGEWTPVRRIWTESYTLNQASLTNPVRLTWTWEKHNGLVILLR